VLGECAEQRVPWTLTGRIRPVAEEGPSLVCRGIREPPDELEDEPPPSPIVGGGHVATKVGDSEGVVGEGLDA